jgi:hypothetical protein
MRSNDLLKTPELNYEQWIDLLRPNFGVYTPDDPKAFVGGFALGASSDLMGRKSAARFALPNGYTIANGHKGIFVLTALITAMPYFWSMDDQRRDRMQAKLQAIKQELRRSMHQPIPQQGRWLQQVVTGYFN